MRNEYTANTALESAALERARVAAVLAPGARPARRAAPMQSRRVSGALAIAPAFIGLATLAVSIISAAVQALV